jgi:hypothetical protein
MDRDLSYYRKKIHSELQLTMHAVLWNIYFNKEIASQLGNEQICLIPRALERLAEEGLIDNPDYLAVFNKLTFKGLWYSFTSFGNTT